MTSVPALWCPAITRRSGRPCVRAARAVEMVNASLFVSCTNRAAAYGGAWVALSDVVRAVPAWPEKDALEYASFHLYELTTLRLRAVEDEFWVNHVSGYEHRVRGRFGAAAAEERVAMMVDALEREQCAACAAASAASSSAFPGSSSSGGGGGGLGSKGGATLAAVPFYGGALGGGVKTGSAHSRASRALKLQTLAAAVCSLLRLASRVVVAVCTAADLEDVRARLGPLGRAHVFQLDCARGPAYLPYRLLNAVRRGLLLSANNRGAAADGDGDGDGDDAARWVRDQGPFDFVAYSEADQVFDWTSRAGLASVFQVLRDVAPTRAYASPQRYEKRYGAPAGETSRAFMAKAMNKCHLRRGAALYTTRTGTVDADHVAPPATAVETRPRR